MLIRIVLPLLLLLTSCESVLYPRIEPEMWSSYVRLQDLKKGMSKSEVLGIMGPPRTKEEGTYARGSYSFFFYQTHSMDYDGSETVRGGFTPLVFQGDTLVGIGRRAYRMAVDRPDAGGMQYFPWELGK